MAEQTNCYAVQRGSPRSFKPVSDGVMNLSTSTQTVGEGQRQFFDVPYVKLTLAMNPVLLNSTQKFIRFKKTKEEKAYCGVKTLFIG